MGGHSGRSGCEIGSVGLRVRTALDVPELGVVLREVHDTAGYPTRWPADPSRWLAAKAGYGAWVAEVAGKLCGHVGLQQDLDCRLAWLTVTGRRLEQLAEVSRLFATRHTPQGWASVDACCSMQFMQRMPAAHGQCST